MNAYQSLAAKAADWLEANPWHQGGAFNPRTGGRCMIGAIFHCSDASLDHRHNLQRANRLVGELDERVRALPVRLRGYRIFTSTWNDAPGRTKEEVIAFLREYAAEIGEPERRRVLVPQETPAPLTPDNPIWTDPAPEEPKRVPVKEPA